MDKKEIEARAESDEGKDLPDEEIGALISAYEQKNPPPNVIPKKQWILCAVGLVGAGKTTVIKPISNALHLARVSNDDIRILLRRGGYNFLRTVDVARKLVEKYFAEHRSIALDADSIIPENREEIIRVAYAHEVPVIFIHIRPPEEFILHKLKHLHYESSGLLKDANDAITNYYRRKPLHEKHLSGIVFNGTFDTSRPDLLEQVDKFIKHLQEQGF